MNNHNKTKKNFTKIITLFIAVFVITSCGQENIITNSPLSVTERIDLAIEGDEKQFVNLESIQSQESYDLVRFNIDPAQADYNRMDFTIKIDEETTLTFKVRNTEYNNIWENTTKRYSLYPINIVDDKSAFVTAELRIEGETPITSYMNESFPRTAHLNVFRIVEFNPNENEILCRVKDFPIIQTNNLDDVQMINGTFKGAVTFL